jgi:adenosylmethionine-8-amino-7-oxononanoate aminotransferase
MPDPIPTLDEILALDRAHLIHPISEFRKDRLRETKIVTGGRGVELTLADGRTVIDGFSGLFNINVGHGRTEIAEAVAAQMRESAYYPSFWDFGNEPAARLAERLVNVLPADRGLRHFLFHNSGSEANEANFKIAKLYHSARGKPWKTKILSRRWAYHGATRSAGSATGIGAYHAMIEQDANHIYVSPPYCYRCEFKKTYPDCGLPCAADVEAVIEREGAATVAALIVEPVMGTGGILVPPADYFAEIAEICRRHDVLLILDEVITGFGRTGKWFGMEHSVRLGHLGPGLRHPTRRDAGRDPFHVRPDLQQPLGLLRRGARQSRHRRVGRARGERPHGRRLPPRADAEALRELAHRRRDPRRGPTRRHRGGARP